MAAPLFFASAWRRASFAPHKSTTAPTCGPCSEAGVEQIIAIAAVGGISAQMAPGSLALPDQIIDYTYGESILFRWSAHDR